MIFDDREHAGRELAAALDGLAGSSCVVGAVPRGGVVVALPVAVALGAPLALVYARKLSSPSWPELAFGALDEDGISTIDPDTVETLGLDPTAIESATARTWDEIRMRMALYRAPRVSDFLPGRGVVLIDDGLATGLTVLAAIRHARRHGATHVTVAVPCASTEAADVIRGAADRLVSLVVDPGFRGVSQYYLNFEQVTDDEVVGLLARAGGRRDPALAAVSMLGPG